MCPSRSHRCAPEDRIAVIQHFVFQGTRLHDNPRRRYPDRRRGRCSRCSPALCGEQLQPSRPLREDPKVPRSPRDVVATTEQTSRNTGLVLGTGPCQGPLGCLGGCIVGWCTGVWPLVVAAVLTPCARRAPTPSLSRPGLQLRASPRVRHRGGRLLPGLGHGGASYRDWGMGAPHTGIGAWGRLLPGLGHGGASYQDWGMGAPPTAIGAWGRLLPGLGHGGATYQDWGMGAPPTRIGAWGRLLPGLGHGGASCQDWGMGAPPTRIWAWVRHLPGLGHGGTTYRDWDMGAPPARIWVWGRHLPGFGRGCASYRDWGMGAPPTRIWVWGRHLPGFGRGCASYRDWGRGGRWGVAVSPAHLHAATVGRTRLSSRGPVGESHPGPLAHDTLAVPPGGGGGVPCQAAWKGGGVLLQLRGGSGWDGVPQHRVFSIAALVLLNCL